MEKNTLIKTNPENENTLKLKGVTKKQISLLKQKKLPIAVAIGLLGGIGSQYAFMSATGRIVPIEEELTDEATDDDSSIDNTEECFDFEVPTTIEFSDAVSDDMSFSEAYKAARADVGDSGFYNWRGSSYHTLTKEEWDALSPDEQQEFLDKIQENSDFNNGEYNKIDDPVIEDDVIEEKEEVEEEKEDDKEGKEKKDVDKEDVIEEKEKDTDEKEDLIDKKDDINEDITEDISDEITFDDLIDVEEQINKDTNVELDDYVTVDEIGDTDDILEGLNDGEATEEAEGIEGGDTYNSEDYETDSNDNNTGSSDDDLEYDDDFADDLV